MCKFTQELLIRYTSLPYTPCIPHAKPSRASKCNASLLRSNHPSRRAYYGEIRALYSASLHFRAAGCRTADASRETQGALRGCPAVRRYLARGHRGSDAQELSTVAYWQSESGPQRASLPPPASPPSLPPPFFPSSKD